MIPAGDAIALNAPPIFDRPPLNNPDIAFFIPPASVTKLCAIYGKFVSTCVASFIFEPIPPATVRNPETALFAFPNAGVIFPAASKNGANVTATSESVADPFLISSNVCFTLSDIPFPAASISVFPASSNLGAASISAVEMLSTICPAISTISGRLFAIPSASPVIKLVISSVPALINAGAF